MVFAISVPAMANSPKTVCTAPSISQKLKAIAIPVFQKVKFPAMPTPQKVKFPAMAVLQKVKGYTEASNTYGAVAAAKITKLNGSQNGLTITVKVNGKVAAEKYFIISNNSSGEFAVGDYKVYVGTSNTKINYCFITYAPKPAPAAYTVTFYSLDGKKAVHSQSVPAGGYIDGSNHGLYNSWSSAEAIVLNYKLKANQTVIPEMLREIGTDNIFNWKYTPITKNINVTLAVDEFEEYKTTVVDPTCTEEGYIEVVYIPTGEVAEYEILPALGHLYDEDEMTDEGAGFLFVCGRCGVSEYARFDDGEIISSDNGDELVKRITDAKIIAEAETNEGMYGAILVTFYITEYCVNGTTDNILYVISVAKDSAGSVDVGRYILEYETFGGELVKLEIGEIVYYSHG
jgi:uncharacterized protein YuzB (UPF0349 family)